MGTRATRIAAADFLTPPELAQCRPLAASEMPAAGRIGGVRIQLANVPTIVQSCYQQVPLRVHSFPLSPTQPTLIYLLNPTAGLFDGDAHLVDLEAGPGTRAVVTGQSATRIHPSVHGFSTQQWAVRVQPGAVLVVLPGPAIPFQGSRYYQRIAVDLASGAHLIWGDIWLAGRYARGPLSEQFRFRTLVQDFSVAHGPMLLFRDRFCWQGPWAEDSIAWHFDGAPAVGSLFVSAAAPGELLAQSSKVRQARLLTASEHTCIRYLGPAQAVTACLVQTAMNLAGLLSRSPQPWLLLGHDLAPNHWFSTEATKDDSVARNEMDRSAQITETNRGQITLE